MSMVTGAINPLTREVESGKSLSLRPARATLKKKEVKTNKNQASTLAQQVSAGHQVQQPEFYPQDT